ncbi:MAG: tRNA uridine-5-carboxymethylaminomethyl(34) synthesis GTPase MnmE, partial [Lachnospiraceae bacterium]|nr:tRNA uridine-5-carboxymethylaminomethyl(34) synthesis GTPase MnmE [Lachnospiraceae bacterium]
MMVNDDTICAIATSLTPAGIGIIRVSGENAVSIVSNIFVNRKKEKI